MTERHRLWWIYCSVPHRAAVWARRGFTARASNSSQQPEYHAGEITTRFVVVVSLNLTSCFMVTFHKENKSKVLLQMSFACAELPAATLTHFRVDVAETLCSISSCLWSDDTPDLQDHQHISESQVSISCSCRLVFMSFSTFRVGPLLLSWDVIWWQLPQCHHYPSYDSRTM